MHLYDIEVMVTCYGELVFIGLRTFRVSVRPGQPLRSISHHDLPRGPSTAMAGLQSFVHGNQLPQSAQPARTGRLQYANNAKVSARTSATHRSNIPPIFPNTNDEYNTPPYEQIQTTLRPHLWDFVDQQPPDMARKGIFDDTLSGLDETESLVFDGRQDVPNNGAKNNRFTRSEDDYDEVETVVEVGSYSQRPASPRGGGITGRFYQPPQGQTQHANMELRLHQNGASTEQQLNEAKKHNRFAGPIGASGKQERVQDGAAGPGNFDASSSGEDSTSDSQNGDIGAGMQNIQSADYDDQQLNSMTYQTLKDETWEVEKHGRTSALPQELQDSAIPLSQRFKSCVDLDGEKEETQGIQVEFFAKMSTTEWEETGDFFIERFAEILTKLKEARRAKRKTATDFEKLVEERETAIREKFEKLDKDLADMRKGGEGVIRGKGV